MSSIEAKGPTIGMRHVQALLLFLNLVVIYLSRVNVGIALVAMTNAEKTNPNFPEYDWDEKQRSYILSSFYWSYILMQFPGGYLCRRFGVKIVLFIATFGTALLSLVTPVCIPWGGWQVFCAIRVCLGLLQGAVFPCVHQHIAQWSPPAERNRIGALSYSGTNCGGVLAMGVTGFIAASPLGWPGISYISGALCLLWCVPWLIFGANNAPASRFISKEERDYIEKSLERSENFYDKKIPVPWKAIATSVPFIVLLVAHCSQGWGNSILQAQLPAYINGVLDKKIESNSLISALPFVAMWVCSYIFLALADLIMHKKWLTLTALRKTFNTLAFWIPAAASIGIGFLEKEQATLAIIFMTVLGGVSAGAIIGILLNPIDLSANHAGLLMGIVNTIGNVGPTLTPIFVGIIVTDVTDRSQWQIIFSCSAVVYFVGNLVYVLWGQTNTQPWDAEDYLIKKDLTEDEKSIKH